MTKTFSRRSIVYFDTLFCDVIKVSFYIHNINMYVQINIYLLIYMYTIM